MCILRLLLFSVLLYNTEARFAGKYETEAITMETTPNATILIPVEDTTPSNRTAAIDWYYGSFAEKKNKTRDYESVPVENNKRLAYDTSILNTTDWWPYDSIAVEKNNTWDYETVPVKNPHAVSDKKPVNLTYADTKPYEDDVGYITIDNGILTAHFPEKRNETENNSKKVGWPYDWFPETEKTTSTRRPYSGDWYDELEYDTTSTTATPYHRHNNTVVYSDTTTTRRPYNWTWFPYSRYNRTLVDFETTTTRRPIITSTTTNIPRNFWYDNITTTSYGYYYNVSTTNATEYDITTTDAPIDNRTNSSETPTSWHNPVNISTNSSTIANEARNYGGFTDFLKKILGYIVPSASNKARNSTITNLAVANGNGNLFFYVYN